MRKSMIDFILEPAVKLVYGAGGIQNVSDEIRKHGDSVLLVMDESFSACGYSVPFEQKLEADGITCVEMICSGAPLVSKVRKGIDICREQQITFVIGIGGGVCMDIAKAIAFGTKQTEDIWKFVTGEATVSANAEHLPVITVVTNPMSGSEVNGTSQLTDDETGIQNALYGGCCAEFAWLNPEYVMTVPPQLLTYNQLTTFWQTADIFLSKARCPFSESAALALMKTILAALRQSLRDPEDRDARGTLLLCSARSAVEAVTAGKDPDWMFYPFQAACQGYIGTSYAKTVPILYPYWLKNIYDGSELFRTFFRELFGVETEGRSDEEILKCGMGRIADLYAEFGLSQSFFELNGTRTDQNRIRKTFESLGDMPSQYIELTTDNMSGILTQAIEGSLR